MNIANMERYSRQIAFFGREKQKMLGKSMVSVVGLGATGSATASLLVRAGIGGIKLIDRDFVEESNLHRAMLYSETDIDKPKALAAKERLEKINSQCNIKAFVEDLNPKTMNLLESDLILDCTDNMETRLLINDFSLKHEMPWIYSGAIGNEGMAASFDGKKPCFRCLFQTVPPSLETCDTVGILSPASFIVSSWQALEAIRILTDFERPNYGKLFHFSGNSFSFSNIKPNMNCRACMAKNFHFLEKQAKTAISLCGLNSYHINPNRQHDLDLHSIAKRLSKNPAYKIKSGTSILHMQSKNHKISIFKDSRVIIAGAKSMAEAKSIYSRILGV